MAEKFTPQSREQYAKDTGISYLEAISTNNIDIKEHYTSIDQKENNTPDTPAKANRKLSLREQYAQDNGMSYTDALSLSSSQIEDFYNSKNSQQPVTAANANPTSRLILPEQRSVANKEAIQQGLLSRNGDPIDFSDQTNNNPNPTTTPSLTVTQHTPSLPDLNEPRATVAQPSTLPSQGRNTQPFTRSPQPSPDKKTKKSRGIFERFPFGRTVLTIGAVSVAIALLGGPKNTNASPERVAPTGSTPAETTPGATPEKSRSSQAAAAAKAEAEREAKKEREESNKQSFDFHFFDKHKESEHAFGKAGVDSSPEASLAELENRYMGNDEKGDPALVAAHAKQLGFYKGFNVNELANKLQSSKDSMENAVKMLKEKGEKSDWKIVDSPADYGSLYMTKGPDGKPNVYFDSQVEHTNPGQALAQYDKEGNLLALYRIDCGYQPVVKNQPVEVPTKAEIITTITTTTTVVDNPPKIRIKHPKTTETVTSSGGGEEDKTKTTTKVTGGGEDIKTYPKDPSKDPDVNPGIDPQKSTGDDAPVPSGELKPATDPPEVYVPPAAPAPPQVERPAPAPAPEVVAPTPEKPADKPVTNPF